MTHIEEDNAMYYTLDFSHCPLEVTGNGVVRMETFVNSVPPFVQPFEDVGIRMYLSKREHKYSPEGRIVAAWVTYENVFKRVTYLDAKEALLAIHFIQSKFDYPCFIAVDDDYKNGLLFIFDSGKLETDD